MKASDIKIGVTYAARYDDKLIALRVSKVITTRTGPHPSDFDHRVWGWSPGIDEELEYGPAGILGPYQEHKELVDQETARRAAAEAQRKAEIDRAKELAALLSSLTGLPPGSERYNDPIRANGGRVELNDIGVEAVLSAMRTVMQRA